MIDQLFYMGGYEFYVWSAFGFTIFCFLALYLITNLQLKKEQKKFLYKFGTLPEEKIEAAKKYKINKDILTSIPNYHF